MKNNFILILFLFFIIFSYIFSYSAPKLVEIEIIGKNSSKIYKVKFSTSSEKNNFHIYNIEN